MPRKAALESLGLATTVLVVVAVFAAAYRFLQPAEDAAILFRYSDHLCATGRIAYNVDGPVTEGATDFLWMLLLAAGRCLGIDPFASALILSACGVVGTALCLADVSGASKSAALALWLVVLAVVPGLSAALLGFSVFFFGFWCALFATAFWSGRPRLLLVAGLVACLTRPDGVVFVLPALVFHGMTRAPSKLTFARDTALLFLAPGAAYFLWRWHYFGEFLPLPFYVKSQFDRVWGLFHRRSLLLQTVYLIALLPVIVTLSRSSAPADRGVDPRTMGRRLLPTTASLLSAPFVFYATMALSQNVGHRFQFPLLTVAAVLWCAGRTHPQFAAPASRRPSWSRFAPLLTLALLSPIWIGDVAYLIDDHWSTRPAIARAMSSLERGKMAVAMAGVLPYYSKWDAVDLWGLNTRALTRRHADPSWIATYDPDLIVIHNDEYAFPGEEREVRVERDWDQLCINAALAARSGGYEAVFVPTLDENRTIAAAKFLHRVRGSIARGRVWAGARVGIAEPRRTPRYDIYFIAPDYGDHLRLRELLESFGGTDTEGYRHRIADTAGG